MVYHRQKCLLKEGLNVPMRLARDQAADTAQIIISNSIG